MLLLWEKYLYRHFVNYKYNSYTYLVTKKIILESVLVLIFNSTITIQGICFINLSLFENVILIILL